ncbi:MAG: PH domain-containing protein [Candidatus Saccharimonadales bacterium]
MIDTQPTNVIRKSIAILTIKVVALQIIIVLIYLTARLSKLFVLRQIFIDDDYHHLNFWLGIMLFMIVIMVQTIILVTIMLQWFNEYYEVKKDIIVHTTGVFKRKEDIYSLTTVEAGNVVQTLLGRILNYGTVKIYSPVLKREYSITDIPNPQTTRDGIISLLGEKRHDDKKIIPKEMLVS